MKLGNGVLDAGALDAAGVNLCLGTDSTASNNNLSLFVEMRMAALLQKSARRDPTALPAARALEMATLGGARALGLEGRVGRLASGHEADIVLLCSDGLHAWPLHDAVSHLVYALGAADVDRVMIAGETLVEGGRFTQISVEEVMARCGEIAARLGSVLDTPAGGEEQA
jgi:5-methylthioadenosine/S-adenosylhomocysteine deaminase